MTSAYRLLPSVDEALAQVEGQIGATEGGRERALEHVRAVIEAWREEIRAGELDEEGLERRLRGGGLRQAYAERLEREARQGIARAINATGVVLHTGLGRAPVHPEAAEAMRAAAASYCVLEVDRESGERGERDRHLSRQLARLTGAEAAIAVNNNAAAVYLALSTFAHGGREVVVSRGELVEIGGSFRIPDVMHRAGVVLREVGTTNRTHLADYEQAIGERTALLMKVHTSNYRLEGFVHEVPASEIAELARARRLPSAYDLGSGLIDPLGSPALAGLGDEPRVRAAVASGVDVVTFSGDKLLGAPQAGLVVGRLDAVAALRRNPIYRALRLDKVALAGLEATLGLMLSGRGGELPARRMLLASAQELRPRAERLAAALTELGGLRAEVAAERSQPGSGSAPGVYLPTFVVQVERPGTSAQELARRLRLADPPVFARIQAERVLLDPRTLLPGDEDAVIAAFRSL